MWSAEGSHVSHLVHLRESLAAKMLLACVSHAPGPAPASSRHMPSFSFLSMVRTRLVGVRWTIDGEGGVLARTLIDEAPEGRLIAKGGGGATRRLCDSSSRLASDRGARRPCTSASAACAAALRYSRVEV